MNLQASITKLGYNAKVLALRMGVTGDGKIRRVNRYKSNSPSVIAAECDIAQNVGVDGFIHIWDGTGNAFVHSSMMGVWAECEKRGMSFAVMMDKWIAANQKPDPTTATINQIHGSDFQKVLNSSCYVPEKYLLEFNVGTLGWANLATVQEQCPHVKLLSEGSGFAWPHIPPIAAVNVPIMSLCPFFNDGGWPNPTGIYGKWDGTRRWGATYWGDGSEANRVNEHQGGNYWMDQLDNISKACKYIMIATWDDHEESTSLMQYAAALSCIRVA